MDAKVQKEIDTLKNMVRTWYKFYLGCANGSKYDQVHVEEFDDVVDEQLSPYLRRLQECDHIDKRELGEFHTWLANRRVSLSKAIMEVEIIKVEDPIVRLLKGLELNGRQREAILEYLKEK